MTKSVKFETTQDGSVWNTIFNNTVFDYKVTESAIIIPLPTDSTFDKFGIKKLYPTKDQEWFVDMANPAGTQRFVNLPSITIVDEPDDTGNMKAFQTSADQVRLEANSIAGKKALNVEVQAYCKWMEGKNDSGYLYQFYGGRGGHHSDSTDARKCLGSAYKSSIMDDGNAKERKEVEHPNYASNKAAALATSKPLKGHWLGHKLALYNITENGKQYPKIETWVDDGCDNGDGKLVIKGNENRWRKVTQYVDRGGWAAGNSGWNESCPALDSNYVHQFRKLDEILNSSGMVGFEYNCIGVWRTDGVTVRWKGLSAREIVPPTL